MIVVAIAAVIAWRRISHAGFCWFWIGAGLWTVAVAVKVVCALLTNAAVIGFLICPTSGASGDPVKPQVREEGAGHERSL